jgi:hypothetical protein
MSSGDPLTLDELRSLIRDKFIGRNDDSIKELESKRRPGRPKDAKLVAAEVAKEVEMAEFASGFGQSRQANCDEPIPLDN